MDEITSLKEIKKHRKLREVKVEMGIGKQPFTEFMKKKRISTGMLIILLIIAWASGFLWRGIYT